MIISGGRSAMKFCWCTITVNDMDESLRFYREVVGLALNRRYKAGPDVEIAFLGDGETKIELLCGRQTGKADTGSGISIGFEVDSIDDKIVFLKEMNIPIHSGPFKPGPNISFFFIVDPNGLKIQFVESR
jgi:lactoylglutathione lyase